MRLTPFILIIFLSIILAGCDKPIDLSELVEREGVHFNINSNKPFSGTAISNHKQFELRERYVDGVFTERYDQDGNEVSYIYFTEDYDYAENSELIEEEKEINEDEYDWSYFRKSNEEPFTGRVIAFHPNGHLNYTFLTVNGEEEGPIELYDENGELLDKGNYKGGREDGIWKTYNEDGKLTRVCYKKGKEVDTSHCGYIEVSCSTMLSEIDANEARAAKKYDNKVIQISGRVSSIDEDLFGEPVVKLSSGQEYSFTSCDLGDVDEETAISLDKGTVVSFECKGFTEVIGSAMLDNCSLL